MSHQQDWADAYHEQQAKRRAVDEWLRSPDAYRCLERAIRRGLPYDMVFAARPTGDPFAEWTRAILAALREGRK